MDKRFFGKFPNGEDVYIYRLTDGTATAEIPGMQFYTGNFLGNGPDFKGDIPQIRQGALCLEAQTEPNCVKHNEAIYPLGDIYRHYTVYEFLSK